MHLLSELLVLKLKAGKDALGETGPPIAGSWMGGGANRMASSADMSPTVDETSAAPRGPK